MKAAGTNNCMNYKSLSVSLILLGSLNSVSIAANQHNFEGCQILSTPEFSKKILPNTSQIIVVKSLGGIKANMVLCQKQVAEWHSMYTSSFSAVIGKNGLASIGTKKEGDLKTPVGFYPVGTTFGTQPLAIKMDYKYITADDKFIDDANHKYYNQWVTGSTDAKSYESMLIAPYNLGAVVNYNMKPTIAGAGSAIFIHLWTSPDSPTAGCIALEKKNLLMMLHWLDKKQHPYVLIA